MRQSVGPGQKRFLVYTSAGDKNAIPLWLRGRQNFDLWVTWYGSDSQIPLSSADYWVTRRGGKFQNLKKDWANNAAIFCQYEAIMVLDDDIVINGTAISRLFELREEYQLMVLQPAFVLPGKVSHPVTRRRIRYKLRYTEFVEVTCALFQREALETFLKAFDGSLAGWGIDFWYLHVLRSGAGFRAGVVDEVPCINPWDDNKGEGREISLLQSDDERIADWQRVKAAFGIKETSTEDYSGGVKSSIFQVLFGAQWKYLQIRLLLRQLKKQLLK